MKALATATRLPVLNPCRRRAKRSLARAARQLRLPVDPPISLAQERLTMGQAVVAPRGNNTRCYAVFKRGVDLLGALVLLAVLGPLMLTVFLVLLVTTRGRPLFVQRRLGYLGRPFWMIKFRTMRNDAESLKHTIANESVGPVFKNRRDPRVTTIGRWLRKTSLDETPQLLHVLSGAMSLVGPRPLVPREVFRFEPWQRGRMSVKPGLTCLWQISGRSEVAFDDWVRMDLWYIRRQSLLTDLWLLLKTPWCVIVGRGAY